MADEPLKVRWEAYRAPHVALLPPMFLGQPDDGAILVLSAQGSQSAGASSIRLVIGNGPDTAVPAEHVAEVVQFLRIIADSLEGAQETCVAALEDHLADLALAEADAEHAQTVSEPPC